MKRILVSVVGLVERKHSCVFKLFPLFPFPLINVNSLFDRNLRLEMVIASVVAGMFRTVVVHVHEILCAIKVRDICRQHP